LAPAAEFDIWCIICEQNFVIGAASR